MIKGYIKKFFSPLLFFSGAVLLSGCCSYFIIPKEEYLHKEDHSEAKIIINTGEELTIEKEQNIVITTGFDSILVKTDSSAYAFSINNISNVYQSKLNFAATGVVVIVVLGVIAGLISRTD